MSRWAKRGHRDPLFDHLVGERQNVRRDGDAERFGSLEIDDELVLGRLLNRQVARLGAFEDFVDIDGRAAIKVVEVGTVAHEASSLGVGPGGEHCRQPMFQREFGEADAPGGEDRRCHDKQSGRAFVRYP